MVVNRKGLGTEAGEAAFAAEALKAAKQPIGEETPFPVPSVVAARVQMVPASLPRAERRHERSLLTGSAAIASGGGAGRCRRYHCREVHTYYHGKTAVLISVLPSLQQSAWQFSRDEVTDESTGFACGAADCILKPVMPEIVRARVQVHLELQSALKGLEGQNERLRENLRLLERVGRSTGAILRGR
jgi:hypothetical protein